MGEISGGEVGEVIRRTLGEVRGVVEDVRGSDFQFYSGTIIKKFLPNNKKVFYLKKYNFINSKIRKISHR